MLTLGICGGFDLVQQKRPYLVPDGTCHDSAAVLVEDGQIVAAVEEERLNRIKHTNKAPVNAIRFCLKERGVSLSDLDSLAFYGSEENCARVLQGVFYSTVDAKPVRTIRQLIHEFLQDGIGQDIDDRKLVFVNHHLAHAVSAGMQSGFPESLVLTIDGAGDFLSGTVGTWSSSNYHLLRSLPVSQSLGFLYDAVIAILGYRLNEEYKVMGLAPYGSPERFRPVFQEICELLPHGDYVIRWDRVEKLYAIVSLRKRGEPLLQEHMDMAAALQESLEAVVFHVLRHFQAETRATSLSMAGGVAHNSTLNGKLVYSGVFQQMFVHPVSHDAGCAIGAALYAQLMQTTLPAASRVRHVFWGPSLCCDDQVRAKIEPWNRLVDFEYIPDIARRSAELIAAGNVIGLAQGRSEFGPRALGNRSILADPRPAENKDIVNRLIKKRESYRPFAPSVLEEFASEYFEMPVEGMRCPFMSFTLKVKSGMRNLLGATTHIDGTARVQTVSREENPFFWELIDEFRKITGVAVVLNTSFNNNVEPIVDSADDALACFLTTGLHYLVVGHYLVSKKAGSANDLLFLSASLPDHARLVQTRSLGANSEWALSYALANTFSADSQPISEIAHRLLVRSDKRSVAEVLRDREPEADWDAVATEFLQLWEKREIILRPRT